MLDLLAADSEGERLVGFIQTILQKLVLCLVYTKEDDEQMKIEMEEEANPYQYEEEETGSEEDNYQSSWTYTTRKLATLCFTRLISNYSEHLWQLLEPQVTQFLASPNHLQK